MASTGRLRVRVYTSQAELPLEGATVLVTQQRENGKYDLLSVQVTDSSGMVRPVELVTPALGESTRPNDTGAAAFAQCSVWAEHPGYSLLRVDGVQVFPGVETVQNMELIPLAEGETSLQQRDERHLTVQDL